MPWEDAAVDKDVRDLFARHGVTSLPDCPGIRAALPPRLMLVAGQASAFSDVLRAVLEEAIRDAETPHLKAARECLGFTGKTFDEIHRIVHGTAENVPLAIKLTLESKPESPSVKEIKRREALDSVTVRNILASAELVVGRRSSVTFRKDHYYEPTVGALKTQIYRVLNNDKAIERIIQDVGLGDDAALGGERSIVRGHNLVARKLELAKLDQCLRHFRRGGSGIVGISGSPGMGKTALAEAWAAHVEEQGSFPDGYFAINFRGYSSQRLQPDEVAEQLLADLGVKDIPANPRGRTRRLASLLSERQVLVLFDNVLQEDDVRELLPEKKSPSFVIVTSRKELEGLSISHRMEPIRLSELEPEDAEYFIRKSAGESRSDGDPRGVRRIAEVCSGLPLALDVVATRLENYPNLKLAEMAHDLEWEESRLQALETSDESTSPRAVFATSYNQLSLVERRAFRLLSLRSSHKIDTYAVSLLSDCEMQTAGRIALRIKSVGLVEERRGRFDMHDLIHEFAGELCKEYETPDVRRATFERLASSYCECVNYACNEKNPRNPMVDTDAVERFLGQPKQRGKRAVDRYAETPERGVRNPARWFEVERTNLVDLVKRACTVEPPIPQAARLAFSLFYFLEAGSHWSDWQAVNEAGYGLALRLDTQEGRETQAGLLRNMGRWHLVQVRDLQDALRDDSVSRSRVEPLAACRQAIEYFKQSLQAYQALCAAQPQSEVLLSRGAVVRRELADATLAQAKLDQRAESFTQALHAYLEVKGLFDGFDDSPARSNALASLNVSLSEVYRQLERYGEAEECLKSALAFAGKRKPDRSYNHPRTKGYAELRYAELEDARGRGQAALDRFGNAIEDFREDDNEIAEARALACKGRLLAKLSRSSEAALEFGKSREILTRLESGEADVVHVWLQQVSGKE
ncbi:NB-ARC domain-containing protein [Amycolatopsis sp. NPDC005003]